MKLISRGGGKLEVASFWTSLSIKSCYEAENRRFITYETTLLKIKVLQCDGLRLSNYVRRLSRTKTTPMLTVQK